MSININEGEKTRNMRGVVMDPWLVLSVALEA